MKVLDKFLDAMKLSDDDDFDEEEEYYDDEDIYEDDKPRKTSFFKRGSSSSNDSYDDEEEDIPSRQSKAPSRRQGGSDSGRSFSKVTPLRSPHKQGGASAMQVCVMHPASVEDSKDIGETLLANRTVILNLEGLDMEVAQRIFDFSSGACFALNGNLQKVSKFIFLITPSNVDISGDLADILSDSFDTPAMRSDYKNY